MADKTDNEKEKDSKAEASGTSRTSGSTARTVARVRTIAARVVWLLCLVAALFLAVGALLIAVDANHHNDLVKFILHGAARVDLGIFSKNDGIKQFHGSNAEVKNALFNWGIGAVVWLVMGRILERLIRP